MTRALNNIGWGLFCASSWTWCIGMYLPVLFIRHWGWPGFLVFAIPNVLGVVAFGYFCSRERSEQLAREHAPAMALFSCVTVAYQVFFVAFIGAQMQTLDSRLPPNWLAALGAIVIGSLLSLGRGRFWPILGAAVTAASLALWFVMTPQRLTLVPGSGDEPALKLAWTAPIMVFGFLLCPWLDRTFHRARQSADAAAFSTFGVAFTLLILLTAAYTDAGKALLLPAVVVHMAMQSTFTIAVHLRELRVAPWPSSRGARRWAILLPALLGVVASELATSAPTFEAIYLLFLGAYALPFPAYVLLFMRPRSRVKPTVARLAALALLVVALAPLAAIGFLQRETWLLPIPVVILFGAMLFTLSAPAAAARE